MENSSRSFGSKGYDIVGMLKAWFHHSPKRFTSFRFVSLLYSNLFVSFNDENYSSKYSLRPIENL